MKIGSIILFVAMLIGYSFVETGIRSAEFYEVLSSSSLEKVEDMLSKLNDNPSESKMRMYKGALIAKRAEFVKEVKQKIKYCREGIALIEAEIKDHPSNTEYRFIRLTIQEHAPKLLNYNNKLLEDKQKIIDGYSSLSAVLKKAIREYAIESKVLLVGDLPK